MLNKQRVHGLGIWWAGLGYYLFYAPYSGLTKALSSAVLPGLRGPTRGTVLLPVSVMATTAAMLGFITLMRWWKYAGRREFFGVSVPCPRRVTFLSGVCMATIMGTTTLAFTFGGISIVLMLVLLRGGVLILAPLVDAVVGRRVRWFSWAAMLTSLLAVAVVLGDAGSYRMGGAATVVVAAYLVAYFFKFRFMSRAAKTGERGATLRYFVEEQMVAAPLLLLALSAAAVVGVGDVMTEFRLGLTTFLFSREAAFAALVGLFYAGLCVCTTLIFLDRRENTFCVPMHCGSSMLAGLTATHALTLLFGQPPASTPQLLSAGLIVVALAFLSPLHHVRLYLGKLRQTLARPSSPNFVVASEQPEPETRSGPRATTARALLVNLEEPSEQNYFDELCRVFLFVCSGNTCRSPMAEAIGNAEIAARLRIPIEVARQANVRVLSAGVSARAGAPMTRESQEALRALGVQAHAHGARNLTAELIHRVEKIFCMAESHRDAVISLVPSAAAKTTCLDPCGDIEDPIGKGLAAYLDCARRIHGLVRLRLDEAGLEGGL